MNLVLNACDAMPNEGELSLREVVADVVRHPERKEGEFVVLTVADTGCGMDEQTLSRKPWIVWIGRQV